MNKSEVNRLYNRMTALDREITREAADCKKAGRKSPRYTKLCAEMIKMKREYEKAKGGGEFNPFDQKHKDIMARNAAFGKLLGRKGRDSHYSLEEDMRRKYL